jgi:hypothetical protein
MGLCRGGQRGRRHQRCHGARCAEHETLAATDLRARFLVQSIGIDSLFLTHGNDLLEVNTIDSCCGDVEDVRNQCNGKGMLVARKAAIAGAVPNVLSPPPFR